MRFRTPTGSIFGLLVFHRKLFRVCSTTPLVYLLVRLTFGPTLLWLLVARRLALTLFTLVVRPRRRCLLLPLLALDSALQCDRCQTSTILHHLLHRMFHRSIQGLRCLLHPRMGVSHSQICSKRTVFCRVARVIHRKKVALSRSPLKFFAALMAVRLREIHKPRN